MEGCHNRRDIPRVYLGIARLRLWIALLPTRRRSRQPPQSPAGGTRWLNGLRRLRYAIVDVPNAALKRWSKKWRQAACRKNIVSYSLVAKLFCSALIKRRRITRESGIRFCWNAGVHRKARLGPHLDETEVSASSRKRYHDMRRWLPGGAPAYASGEALALKRGRSLARLPSTVCAAVIAWPGQNPKPAGNSHDDIPEAIGPPCS